ncbi:hypothetical protein [Herbihabitans rhizosphaerae]|uniref:hypothetical protein n=1 Tax=Herbihabitans rhizosphaerae TaxID=1872711 RepID=UPI00102BF368|nr:hypothetical protein [Herbihabitans rhizosphaerae]
MTLIVAFLAPLGALGAQWVAGVRAYKLAEVERAAKREDRGFDLRYDAYAAFLAVARTVRIGVEWATTAAQTDTVLSNVREAAARVELCAPAGVTERLAEVVSAAEEMAAARWSGSVAARAARDSGAVFDTALTRLREAMRDDLGVSAGA